MINIEIKKQSIVDADTQAIVNAANEGLWAGEGVCGAIFKAAGMKQLQDACNRMGHCNTGSAVITPGFDLCEYIIHAVGPRYTGSVEEETLLKGAYRKSLMLCKENGIKSVCFPLISAGIFGYPIKEAWIAAIEVCAEFEKENYDLRIVFAILSDEIIGIGKEILKSRMNFS